MPSSVVLRVFSINTSIYSLLSKNSGRRVLRRRLGVSDYSSLRPPLTSMYWPVTLLSVNLPGPVQFAPGMVRIRSIGRNAPRYAQAR